MSKLDRTFSVSEAAALTGVSLARQRDLRRHGYIPSNGGRWARYSLEAACRLRLFHQFSLRGFGPARVAGAVEMFAGVMAENCRSNAADPANPARFGIMFDDGAGEVVTLGGTLGVVETCQRFGVVTVVDLQAAGRQLASVARVIA